MKHWLRHPALTLALSATLVLTSGTAAALGLGQIEVRSRAGQPLLAEIPIITADPAELEGLDARLASPETFARVGLQAPEGVVADLRFSVGTNAQGRPVIRVTSDAPIGQPLVTFLVEVEWGQGRLVREYSALVDAPRTVAAPVQTPIQAPTVSSPNVVQRPVAEPPQAGQARAAAAVPAGADAAGSPSGEYGPVRRGDTLSGIAGRLGLTDGHTLDQAMIALLRANPDAFIGGDINQLRRGAVLRVPQPAELAAVDAAQASEIVRNRLQQWRQARRPATTAASAEPVERAGPVARTAAAPAVQSRTATTTPGARLEIAPPAPSRAKRAGTQSGLQAGGEGQMLSQEVQQTRETLAAREAELQELKGRIAELERLQADQQRLLELKDAELASVQKRVATTQQPDPGAAAPPPPQPREPQWWPWLLGVAALLAAGFGWWWRRRDNDARPAFRAPPASSSATSLAAAFPSRGPVADDSLTRERSATPDAASAAEDEATVARNAPAAPQSAGLPPATPGAEPAEAPASPGAAPFVPLWHVPESPVESSTHAGEPPSSASSPAPGASPIMETVESAIAPHNERIELARAYIELGDHESARQLLGEVAVTGDHASRQLAARMLREID